MPVSTYTLLDVCKVISFRVGNLKPNLETVENPDPAIFNLVECVNGVIRKINQVKALPVMNGEAKIALRQKYTTGTVAVTIGSTTVVGTSTVWDATMVGAAFSTLSKNGLYRIANVISATQLELDTPWADETAATEGYIIGFDRYELPGDYYDAIGLNLSGPSVRTLTRKDIGALDTQRFTMRGRPLTEAAPTIATIFTKEGSNLWELEVDPFPNAAYVLEVKYRKVSSRLVNDADVIPLEDQNIDLVYNGAVALWKDSNAGQGAGGAFDAWMASDLAMYASFDRKSTDSSFGVVPADVMRSGRSRPSGLMDLGISG